MKRPERAVASIQRSNSLSRLRRVSQRFSAIPWRAALRIVLKKQPAARGEVVDQRNPAASSAKSQLDNAASRMVSFVEHAPLAMFSMSADGTVLAWNRAAEAMFGWSAAEVIGRFVPFVDPDKLEEAAQLRVRTMASQPVVDMQVTRRRRDGSAIMLSVSNAPLLDDNGNAVGIITIASDITERHRTRAALDASRARNDVLLGMSVDWYWEQDADFRFTSIEGSGAIAQRLMSEQIIGKTRRELPLFGVSAEAWAKHEALLEARKPFRGFTYVARSAKGEERIFRISGDPVFHADGGFLGYRGVGTDVTPLVRATEALQESERTLATLMGNLPGMAYRMLADATHTIAFASEGGQLITGYSPDEIQHKRDAHLLELIHADDRSWVMKLRKQELNARRPYVLEYRIVDKAGALRWVWEHACGIYDASGQLEAIEGFVLDIT